ncbi:uncharacterized protein PpBr36_10252 [Pyricularia pennisetigena]|uniref:uncharacterized protein n=1 Tax=Pyricularia pennisetigena TaxID=1578925 RepID=UPI001151E17E|nr:uncharacterized protein PpBr36_10252 [Pyricularia pennisetigena]TLS21542.1 hypothetical protein PpBr36_10252 [Pyricularia pennisetigena]
MASNMNEDTRMEDAMDFIHVDKSPSPSCASSTSRVPVEHNGNDCKNHRPVPSSCDCSDHAKLVGQLITCQDQLTESNRNIRKMEEAANNNFRLVQDWIQQQQHDYQVSLHCHITEINQEWHHKTQNLQARHQTELASLQKQISNAQALVQQLERSLGKEQTYRASAEAEALENHKRWRKTAAELCKLQSTSRQSNKISDQDLIDGAKQLRWMVRNLSATGFSDVPIQPRLSAWPSPAAEELRQVQFLLHTNRFPIYFEASIWHYLIKYVFGRYVWAGEAAQSMQKLYYALQNAAPTEKTAVTLQDWRTNTNALVATTAATTPAAGEALLAHRADFTHAILQLNKHRCDRMGLVDDLAAIFDAAVSLDRDIHLRPGIVEWQVLPPGNNEFNPDVMAVENDGEAGQRVLAMVSPGLVKKVHNAVQDDMLCKMEVVCGVDGVTTPRQMSAPIATNRDNGMLGWIHGLKRIEKHFIRKAMR